MELYDTYYFYRGLYPNLSFSPDDLGEGVYLTVSPSNTLCKTSDVPPYRKEEIPEWYAVRVPGHIIRPSDGDFSMILFSKNRSLIGHISELVERIERARQQICMEIDRNNAPITSSRAPADTGAKEE